SPRSGGGRPCAPRCGQWGACRGGGDGRGRGAPSRGGGRRTGAWWTVRCCSRSDSLLAKGFGLRRRVGGGAPGGAASSGTGSRRAASGPQGVRRSVRNSRQGPVVAGRESAGQTAFVERLRRSQRCAFSSSCTSTCDPHTGGDQGSNHSDSPPVRTESAREVILPLRTRSTAVRVDS